MPGSTISAQVEARLAPLLGPNMARSALRTFSQRSLGKEPETLTAADVPALLAALRPALRTLLGSATAEQLLERLAREIG
jgi:hypothetical protein